EGACESELPREIVVHHPVDPERLERVEPHAQAMQRREALSAGRRGRVECHPSSAWEVCLYPTMRVTGADHVHLRDVVVFTGKESVHNTRRDAQRPQHHGHRTGEILAVTAFLFEQQAGKRSVAGARRWNRPRRPYGTGVRNRCSAERGSRNTLYWSRRPVARPAPPR